MCSIGGFISDVPLHQYEARRLCMALLYHGSHRGSQSSGIWLNNTLYKKAMHPHQLIQTDEFVELFQKPVDMALIHTRMPTSGGLGDSQAHPFWIGNTVSVHNGHISNIKAVKEKWQIDKPSGVDSELFAAGIDKLGIDKLHEFAEEVSGSAALAIAHEGELYVARDSNPLEYFQFKVTGDDGGLINVVVFASSERQVISSTQHVWLTDSLSRTMSLPEKKTFRLRPDGSLAEVCAFKLRGYDYSSQGYGRGMYDGGEWDGDYGVGRHISHSRSYSGPYGGSTHYGHGSTYPITSFWDKGKLWIRLAHDFQLTAEEVVALETDKTIEDAVPTGPDNPNGWRKFGWKKVTPMTDANKTGVGPDSGWEYSYQYAMKQKIKYGELKCAIGIAKRLLAEMKSFHDAADKVDAKVASRLARKQEQKKRKKDRDRNRQGCLSLVPVPGQK